MPLKKLLLLPTQTPDKVGRVPPQQTQQHGTAHNLSLSKINTLLISTDRRRYKRERCSGGIRHLRILLTPALVITG